MTWRGSGQPAPGSAADSLRPLLFGDLPLESWPPDAGAAHDGGTGPDAEEPWRSFVQARELARAGRMPEAVAIWRDLGSRPGLEARHTLQAWHFLRAAGVLPDDQAAPVVLAAVAEVAVPGGHDLLVGYRDGSARYLNRSGSTAVVDRAGASFEAAVASWIGVADGLAAQVGVWEGAELPPLPGGHTRVMMLTPGGVRFGQGPDALVRQDAAAAQYLEAATQVLLLVVGLTGG